MNESKVCSKCRECKPLEHFAKNSQRKDGLQAKCKACVNERYRTDTEYRAKMKANSHRYYHDNWDRVRQYRIDTAAARAEYNKAYKPRRAEWIAKRKREDPGFKLHLRVQHRILMALKTGDGLQKSAGTRELLGLDPQTARAWIEFQFEPGMSWDNHGGAAADGDPCWEIDHVLPVTRFDLADPAQQRVAFAWTNLQPKWKQDNRSKHNAIRPHEFFNTLVSAHRFIRRNGLDRSEYQRLRESVAWLRASQAVTISLDDGRSPDRPEMGNPQPKS